MNAIAIIIGDEILYGKTIENNGSTIAKYLSDYQIELLKIEVIGDDEDIIINTIENAFLNCSLVITSGGLGPTPDDKTKGAVVKLFKKELVVSDHAKSIVDAHYRRDNRDISKDNSYHKIPQGFTAVYNPKGLAPGLFYRFKEKMLLTTPGVPHELKSMLHEEFIKYLPDEYKSKLNTPDRVYIRTSGIEEEKIFFSLCPNLWDELLAFGKVSSLPGCQIPGVDIVISLNGKVKQAKDKIINLIKTSKLYDYVWSFDKSWPQDILFKKLKEKKMTISFAESCTGGLISDILTNVAGSSEVFKGSIISYGSDVKKEILNISESSFKNSDAVTKEVAEDMANNVLKLLKTDICVSITGEIGPLSSGNSPIGTAFIAISTKDNCIFKKIFFRGDRKTLKQKFAYQAIYYAIEYINSM